MINTTLSPVVVSSLQDVDSILCDLVLEAYKNQDVDKEQIDSNNFFQILQKEHMSHISNKDYNPIIIDNCVFNREENPGLFRLVVEFNGSDFYDTTLKVAVVDFTEEEKLAFDKAYFKVFKQYIPDAAEKMM